MGDNNNTSTNLTDIPLSSREGEDTLNGGESNSHVKALTDFLADAQTPMTIALQGEWGSGKTSLMNQIAGKLCLNYCPQDVKHKKPYLGVWINTWQYALMKDEKEALVGLVQGMVDSISAQVEKYLDKDKHPKLTEIKDKLTSTFSAFALTAVRVGIGAMGVNPNSMDDLSKALAKQSESGNPDHLKENLVDCIHQYIEEIKAFREKIRWSESFKGFVFFIDDLDRLEPAVAVQILSLLKNVFEIENCIFVLAIDYDVVVKGLEKRFGKKTEENEREYRSFFDKIIQLSFRLPVARYNIEKYLRSCIEKIGYIDKKDKKNFENNVQEYVNLTLWTCDRNPRSIKRMLNTLSLIKRIADLNQVQKDYRRIVAKSEKALYPRLLFALVAIQVAYPLLYEKIAKKPNLYSWVDDKEVLEEVKHAQRKAESIAQNGKFNVSEEDSNTLALARLGEDAFSLEDVLAKDVWMRKRQQQIRLILAEITSLIVEHKIALLKLRQKVHLDTTKDVLETILDVTSMASAREGGVSEADATGQWEQFLEQLGKAPTTEKVKTDVVPETSETSADQEEQAPIYPEALLRKAKKFFARFLQCYDESLLKVEPQTSIFKIKARRKGGSYTDFCEIDFRKKASVKDRFIVKTPAGDYMTIGLDLRETENQCNHVRTLDEKKIGFLSTRYQTITQHSPLCKWDRDCEKLVDLKFEMACYDCGIHYGAVFTYYDNEAITATLVKGGAVELAKDGVVLDIGKKPTLNNATLYVLKEFYNREQKQIHNLYSYWKIDGKPFDKVGLTESVEDVEPNPAENAFTQVEGATSDADICGSSSEDKHQTETH